MKILVLHADSLQLGFLGCYGNEWVATPNLDRLAAEGVVFDRHVADLSPHSQLTGHHRFPLPGEPNLTSVFPTLPEILQTQGIKPVVFDLTGHTGHFANVLCRKISSWAKVGCGLLWADLPTFAPPWNVPAEFLEPYFIEEGEDEDLLSPWLDPPTGPIDPDGLDQERLQNTYAAQVTFFDAQVGKVVEDLRQRGLLDEILLFVTSSSGLALGEHGYVGGHRAWLHEELVHVPLLCRWPGAADAGLRIGALTQPVDLLPTVVDALGLAPVATHGFSLLPLVRGEVAQVRAYACSGLQIGHSLEWALRTPAWALLLPLTTPRDDPPRNPQLFVKPDDRWEVNDVRHQNQELAEELEKTLREFIAGS